MKKIAFTLYVFAIIIMFSLYTIPDPGSVAKKTPGQNTPVSITVKAEEPLKVFVKVKNQQNNQPLVNRFHPYCTQLNYNFSQQNIIN